MELARSIKSLSVGAADLQQGLWAAKRFAWPCRVKTVPRRPNSLMSLKAICFGSWARLANKFRRWIGCKRVLTVVV